MSSVAVAIEQEDVELSDLQLALKQRSANAVMAVVKGLDARGLIQALEQAGFSVGPGLAGLDRAAIFDGVKDDLGSALVLGVDGHSLRSSRMPTSFAAKDVGSGSLGSLSFGPADFDGDYEAARVIQGVLRASRISVALIGDVVPSGRASLLMVAGQSLMANVQGFGFEGVAGKYEVPLTLHDMVALHQSAAVAVARESACSGVGQWAAGRLVTQLHSWVPDTVQRLLMGPVSFDAAQAVVGSIESRGFESHASDIGLHGITSMLLANGLDIDAPTIEQQAGELGLVVREPNRERGQHFGTVMGVDHRAGLVKVTRTDALELPFSALASGQARPVLGDSVHMSFKSGKLAVKVAERERGGVGR